MKRAFTTIDDYVSTCPNDVQRILEHVLRTAHDAAPAVGEAIAYAMPTITLDGKDLLYFAAWKRHLAFYAVPVFDDALEQELAPYRAATGTLRFPFSVPLPDDLIARLVIRCVATRLAGPL